MMAGTLVLLAVSCSPYKYETVKGDPLETKIYTLDNGLKVYMSVNEEAPRVKANIVVKVGGKNDPSETTGLAHYFEHLMFKGTSSSERRTTPQRNRFLTRSRPCSKFIEQQLTRQKELHCITRLTLSATLRLTISFRTSMTNSCHFSVQREPMPLLRQI